MTPPLRSLLVRVLDEAIFGSLDFFELAYSQVLSG